MTTLEQAIAAELETLMVETRNSAKGGCDGLPLCTGCKIMRDGTAARIARLSRMNPLLKNLPYSPAENPV